MDREIRDLERRAATGDAEAENILYFRYRRLGDTAKLCALLTRKVRAKNYGKNLNCFPVFSWGWKDADLEPSGCTGIHLIECNDLSVIVTVGGHKTFAPDEEGLHDSGYMDALHDSFAHMTTGYDCDWTGDDWAAGHRSPVEVVWQPTLSDMVELVIEKAEAELLEFCEDMQRAHADFYGIEMSQEPGACEECQTEDEQLSMFEDRWICDECLDNLP